jgi:hypothetical protein
MMAGNELAKAEEGHTALLPPALVELVRLLAREAAYEAVASSQIPASSDPIINDPEV